MYYIAKCPEIQLIQLWEAKTVDENSLKGGSPFPSGLFQIGLHPGVYRLHLPPCQDHTGFGPFYVPGCRGAASHFNSTEIWEKLFQG